MCVAGRIVMRWLLVCTVLLAASGAWAGTYNVSVDNVGALETGHGVQWRGQVVGKVNSIRPAGAGVEVGFSLEPGYAGLMHADNHFQVNNGLVTGRPSLDIYGQIRDVPSTSRAIASPQALDTGVTERDMPKTQMGVLITIFGLALAAGIIFTVGRKLLRMVVVGFAVLAFLVVIAFFFIQWQHYREAYMSAPIEAAAKEIGDSVFRSESARNYWNSIQTEFFGTLDRLSDGVARPDAGDLKRAWSEQIEEQIKELSLKHTDGELIGTLKRFRDELMALLARSGGSGKSGNDVGPDSK